MKLSVVIICWNDSQVILDCLDSIYAQTRSLSFEVIVSDNGSSDGSVERIRQCFPHVRIVENETNLGFGRGNNAGIQSATGEYILILNPDTLIHDHALERLVAFADDHPNAGAYGCRTLNPDGSLQASAQPMPTLWRYLVGALCLRWFGRYSDRFLADNYVGWDGRTAREIGFQAGCSLMVRGMLLKDLGGFDVRFSHQLEDADLCRRVWLSGRSVMFCPDAEITHIGGKNRGCYPIGVVLETQRSKYRYFHKYYGQTGVGYIRWMSLVELMLRYAGYSVLHFFGRERAHEDRLRTYRVLIGWHWHLDPIRFIEKGDEPYTGYTHRSPDLYTAQVLSEKAGRSVDGSGSCPKHSPLA